VSRPAARNAADHPFATACGLVGVVAAICAFLPVVRIGLYVGSEATRHPTPVSRTVSFAGSHTGSGLAVVAAALLLTAVGVASLVRRGLQWLAPLALAAALVVAVEAEDVAAQSLNHGIDCEIPPEVSLDCRQPVLHAGFRDLERRLGPRKIDRKLPLRYSNGVQTLPALWLLMLVSYALVPWAAYRGLRLLMRRRVWIAWTLVVLGTVIWGGLTLLDLTLRGYGSDGNGLSTLR
jgi:hypothetical protein